MKTAPSKMLSILVALAVASALFVTAQGRSSAHPSQASLPTLRFSHFTSLGKLANHLDPALVSLANDADTVAMVDYGLVYVGVDNKVHLGLAQKYTVSKNRKVYTFTLRKGLKYADGHPIVAGDIKFAVERALAPSTASEVASTYLIMSGASQYTAGKASSVSGVKVVNKSTIQFTLDKPFAYFLKTLTYSTAYPLDPAVVRGKTAAATGNFLSTNCPGNVATSSGPFVFKCSGNDFYPTGQTPHYTLIPNKNFYGKKPTIQVLMTAYSSVDVAYTSYRAGDLDALTTFPSGFVSQWKKSSQYLQWPTSRVYFFTPNFHMAPFTNVHCRLAVAYGINRSLIANTVLHGTRKPIYDIVPSGFLGYYSGKDNPHFNLTKAKAEFNACGSIRNTPVKLVYPTGTSDNDNQYGEVANEMRAIGFNASTNALSSNDWGNVVAQSLDKTKTQITQNGWQQDYPDPQDYVTLLLHTGYGYDIGGFNNAAFDKLTDKADLEGNVKLRAQEYIQAQHMAISQGAWISYLTLAGTSLVKPYVHGLLGTVAYANLVPKNYDWSQVTISKH